MRPSLPNDEVLYFRNAMAERGVEYTPEQAKTAKECLDNFLEEMRNMDLDQIRQLKSLTISDKIDILQAYMEDGLWDIADRHLKLRGFPTERYEDLKIKMTPPSEWRELSRAEVVTNRINNAGSLKGAQIMSDYDVLVLWLKYSEKDAKELIARNKIQKLEDLKLQVMAQNPILLGVGTPGGEGKDGQEMGTEAGGQQPMPGGEGQPPPEGQAPEGGQPEPPEGGDQQGLPQGGQKPQGGGPPLETPSSEDVKKFDLGIEDFASGKDEEDIDYSEED